MHDCVNAGAAEALLQAGADPHEYATPSELWPSEDDRAARDAIVRLLCINNRQPVTATLDAFHLLFP